MKFWPFSRKKTEVKPVQKRAFAGAQVNRLTFDWVAQSTSQDSEIRSSLVALRSRTRQLVRDNDYVKNALREIQNNVVGQGVKFQSQIRMRRGGELNKKLNDMLEWEWAMWGKAHSCHTAGKLCFSDIERLIMSEVPQSGEILIRIIRQKFGRSRVPFALEIIDSDYLDETHNEELSNGNIIKMGVECDRWGRPVAYHLKNKHPFDWGQQSNLEPKGGAKIVVPAGDMIHLFMTERARQTRGFPWFAASLTRVKHMAGYEEAMVIGGRAAACLMGFIETPDGELIGDDIYDGERVTEFEPAVIKKLNAGEKINVPNIARPNGEFDPFMRVMLRGLGAGVGVSYESISKDYSQSNYSSSRMSLLPERDNWRVIQLWLINNFHKPIFAKWLEAAVMSGTFDVPEYEMREMEYLESVRFIARGWSWVDPTKEIAAYKEAILSGFSTVSDVLAHSGGDYEELLETRKRELEQAEAMGLKFETMPESMHQEIPSEPSPIEEKKLDAAILGVKFTNQNNEATLKT